MLKDWRLTYVQRTKFGHAISPFKVMNVLQKARRKESSYSERRLGIAPCKTETAEFVIHTETMPHDQRMDETIIRIASFACMVDEVRDSSRVLQAGK